MDPEDPRNLFFLEFFRRINKNYTTWIWLDSSAYQIGRELFFSLDQQLDKWREDERSQVSKTKENNPSLILVDTIHHQHMESYINDIK